MKLSFILVFCSIMCLFTGNGFAQDAKISLNLINVTVEQVLNEIERQSGYYFLLNQKLISSDRKVSIQSDNKPVREILDELFATYNISYLVYDRQIILFQNENKPTPNPMSSQFRVSGTITDARTGEPLAGVNIIVEGTTRGTISDPEGRYELYTQEPNTSILQVSYVGYTTKRVAVASQSIVNIQLESSNLSIEEVILVGYGTQRRSLVTGAISSIGAGEIESTSCTRGEISLKGRLSGVQIIQNSGAPGAGIMVRVRGYGSNQRSEPIYIVDGTRVASLNMIETRNIESIEVLKDAASSAIYGAEGANGVVIVKTKEGRATSFINYDYQFGVQALAKKVELLNASEYVSYMTEAGLFSGTTSRYDTDWQNEVFETAPIAKHYLSYSGANSKGAFLLSLSYLNQDGIVKGDRDRFERYSLMFNSHYQVKDWLKVGHNVTFTRTDLKAISENSEYGSVITNTLMIDPLTPASYRDALPSSVQALLDAKKLLLKDHNGNYYGISEFVTGEIGNPLVEINKSKTTTQNNALFGNLFQEFSPLQGLTYTSRLGGTITFSNTHSYYPEYYYNSTLFNNTSNVSETMFLSTYMAWENYANYTLNLNRHSLAFMLGMSFSENRSNYVYASAGPLTTDNDLYDDLSFVQANPNDNVAGMRTLTRKLSYFGRVNYDLGKRYLLEASLRRDAAGADILPRENRWGTFPSFSAGWVVSNEPFFEQIAPYDLISFLKFRASWGQNGSLSNLNSYNYISLLTSSGSYPLLESWLYTATLPNILSNRELGWEKSEQFDIGVNLKAIKDKLSLSIDYFVKTTKDLLTQGTPPLEAGNNAPTVNAGDVQNKGFEFEAEYRNSFRGLNYSVKANFTSLSNKVTWMNPNNPRLSGAYVNLHTATLFEKGYPIWYFYGYKPNGIDPASGEPVYVDTDGKKGITSDDKTFIGSGIPDITYGGEVKIDYRGIDCSMLLQGQHGNEIMLGAVRTDRPMANKFKVFYNDRWTSTHTNASMPRAGCDDKAWHSDLLIFDGSYLKIKQIQIGYTFPRKWLSRIQATKLRGYVAVENAFTLSHYPGLDPEIGSAYENSLGIDRGVYPNCRTILFGASITF